MSVLYTTTQLISHHLGWLLMNVPYLFLMFMKGNLTNFASVQNILSSCCYYLSWTVLLLLLFYLMVIFKVCSVDLFSQMSYLKCVLSCFLNLFLLLFYWALMSVSLDTLYHYSICERIPFRLSSTLFYMKSADAVHRTMSE